MKNQAERDSPAVDLAAVRPLLVDGPTAARLCGVSRSTWALLSAKGLTPEPVRLAGRKPLWSLSELERWTAAGCLPRARWDAKKRAHSLGTGTISRTLQGAVLQER